MTVNDLYREAQQIAPWMIKTRRALHRIPEKGFCEFKTQALLMEHLTEMSIPFETNRTWIVADIHGGHPGPTVALRADMDALSITEPQSCPFRSEHEGWMHACGHDMHMAVQLGAARLLNGMREDLRGNVRLLFQPAEETVGGAMPMVDAGVLKGVDAVYGMHVQPYMNVGRIDTRPGCLNASTDELKIVIHGVSAHAARPHQGVDAIVCAAQLITALQTVVSRSTSPLQSAVISLGVIHGGEAPNIVCDRVEINGTMRTADTDLRAQLKQRIREICDGVASTCGTTIELDIVTGYAALMNTPAEAERVIRIGRRLLGAENAAFRDSPSMGGEDFSYFVERVPGAFWQLGCASAQPAPTLHSRDFVPDERCLPIGAALQAALALDRMGMLD